MGLKDSPLWELQWHPAQGGKVRRIVLTWRGLRRVFTALGIVTGLVVAVIAIMPFGLQGVFSRFTLEEATRENHLLRQQAQGRRDQTWELVNKLHSRYQRARRLVWVLGASDAAWGKQLRSIPSQEGDNEAVVQWLDWASQSLLALADAAVAYGATPPIPLRSLPLVLPVAAPKAVPVSLFGFRTSPFTGKTMANHGVVLASTTGESVVSTGDGTVIFAGAINERRANEWTRFGIVVLIDHGGGIITLYGHMREQLVKRGQVVARGQRIGTVGQTGWTRVPATYYEVRWPLGGGSQPIDPALVAVDLPIEDMDHRFLDPKAGLPDDYALIEHLLVGGRSRSGGRSGPNQ